MYVQVPAARMGLVRGGGKNIFFFLSFKTPLVMNFFTFWLSDLQSKKRFGGSQLARPYGIVLQYVVKNA